MPISPRSVMTSPGAPMRRRDGKAGVTQVMLTLSTSIGIRIQKVRYTPHVSRAECTPQYGMGEPEEYHLKKIKRYYIKEGSLRIDFGSARAVEAIFYTEHSDSIAAHLSDMIRAVTAGKEAEDEVTMTTCQIDRW